MLYLRSLLAAALLSTSALACSAAPGGQEPVPVADEAAATAPSTLDFRADWTVKQDKPLVAGGRVRFVYAAERVERCTGDHRGAPAWTTTAYASFDGEAPVTKRVAGFDPSSGGDPPILDVPRGASSVEIWFQTTNRWGCMEWDSNYGDNYGFPVDAR